MSLIKHSLLTSIEVSLRLMLVSCTEWNTGISLPKL